MTVVTRSRVPAIQGPKRRMAPRSRMDAMVMVPPRTIGTGSASATTRSRNQTPTPHASHRVCLTSGPPKIARSTGRAARKDGRRSHTNRGVHAARAGDSVFGSSVITSSASSLRPKAPPLANGFRFRTECARERVRAPGDNFRSAPESRVGAPTASTNEPRGVVQAEAGHFHHRVGPAEDLGTLDAEQPLHAEILDGERGHHASVHDGGAEGAVRHAPHARERAEEAARERVS